MRLIRNVGADRVLDRLDAALMPDAGVDVATPHFSLFAFAALKDKLSAAGPTRLLVSGGPAVPATARVLVHGAGA